MESCDTTETDASRVADRLHAHPGPFLFLIITLVIVANVVFLAIAPLKPQLFPNGIVLVAMLFIGAACAALGWRIISRFSPTWRVRIWIAGAHAYFISLLSMLGGVCSGALSWLLLPGGEELPLAVNLTLCILGVIIGGAAGILVAKRYVTRALSANFRERY